MEQMDKSALKSTVKVKRSGNDVAGLNSLLGMLNNPEITGADVPKGENVRAQVAGRDGATLITDPMPTMTSPKKPNPAPPPAQPAPPHADRDMSRIFFTGRLMSGKDWIAEKIGAKIFGYADPLYAVQEFFFPDTDKTTPGARAFLQNVGQWGRNEINDKYPLTVGRAVFVSIIRNLGSQGHFGFPDVDWKSFGRNKEIWADALQARVAKWREENPGKVVAVTNVRFENELARMNHEGWTHFHVTCSPITWRTRLTKAGLTPESPEVNDMSERLAAALDADVVRKISRGSGRKLRVIWCDNQVVIPSELYYSIAEFQSLVLQHFPAAIETPADVAPPAVNIGEIGLED